MPNTNEIRKQLALGRKNRADAKVAALNNLLEIEQYKENQAYAKRSAWLAIEQFNDNFKQGEVMASPNYSRANSLATYAAAQKAAMYQQYLDYGDNVDSLLIKAAAAESEQTDATNYYNGLP